MPYRVELLPRADKELDALPRTVQLRIVRALRKLSDDPRPAGAAKLVGEENLWRIRIGAYRVLYQIHDDRVLVVVLRIAHRRDVYRKR